MAIAVHLLRLLLLLLLACGRTAAFNPAGPGADFPEGRRNPVRPDQLEAALGSPSADFSEFYDSEPDLLGKQASGRRREARLTRRHVCLGSAAALAAAAALISPWTSASAAAPELRWEEVPGIGGTNRRYGLVKLPNGIRAMVVQDKSATTCQLSATVGCGNLDDPPEFEGLAHLAEHVTIITDPLQFENYVQQDLGGDSNAFTGERTTTFHADFDFDIDSDPGEREDGDVFKASTKNIEQLSTVLERFAAIFPRALSPDAPEAAPFSIIRQEVPRVNEEFVTIPESYEQRLLEMVTYKARTPESSKWRKLGRGDFSTLPIDKDSDVKALSDAITRLRLERYLPESLTVAVIAPIPIETTSKLIGKYFSQIQGPSSPPSEKRADSRPLFPISPFSNTKTATGIKWKKSQVLLQLAWDVAFNDLRSEALQKPLAILGHALQSSHEGSLASMLRAQGLAPPCIEAEPCISTKSVARADEWVLWKMDIILDDEAASRWREALALAVTAVKRLAETGVPVEMVSELQRIVEANWKYFPLPPTAIDLSNELQRPLPDEATVVGTRLFVGEPSAVASTATAAAVQIAAKYPAVTVWAPDLKPLGVEAKTGPPMPVPFNKLATLVPLQMPGPNGTKAGLLTSALSPAEAWTKAYLSTEISPTQLLPPPANPWMFSAGGPKDQMQQAAYLFAGAGGRLGKESGLSILQLPGCVSNRLMSAITGDTTGLFEVTCPSSKASPPFATAVLHLDSQIPASATPEQGARAEFWRWTFIDAISELAGIASRAGLRCDISFDGRGLRLLISGFGQRLPALMKRVLKQMLNHLPPDQGPVLEAARRKAKLPVKGRRSKRDRRISDEDAAAVNTELDKTNPDDVSIEINRFFKSVTGAHLFLAGTIEKSEAQNLALAIKDELQPLLPMSDAPPTKSTVEAEIATWNSLLYRSDFVGSIDKFPCQEPAFASTLGQCRNQELSNG